MNNTLVRPSNRDFNQMRKINLLSEVSKHAEGSCLVEFGDTHVLCTASVETKVPSWLRGTGKGWITAEYGMLPRSTNTRMDREAVRGKQSGRTQEIQRLIGRSLRAIVNLNAMSEIQIRIDCDVIQADGGTRTAAISGAYIALYKAFKHCKNLGYLKTTPFTDSIAAVSCGVFKSQPILDLDYAEDSIADVDANFILTGKNQIVEIQTTAEGTTFSENTFMKLLGLAKKGIKEITTHQKQVIGLD